MNDPEVTINGTTMRVTIPVVVLVVVLGGLLWRFETRMNELDDKVGSVGYQATEARSEARQAKEAVVELKAEVKSDNDRQDSDIRDIRNKQGKRDAPIPASRPIGLYIGFRSGWLLS